MSLTRSTVPLLRTGLLATLMFGLAACGATNPVKTTDKAPVPVKTKAEPAPKPKPIGSTLIGDATLWPSDCKGPVFGNDLFKRDRGTLDVAETINFLDNATDYDLANTRLIINYDGPLGVLLREQGMTLYPASDKLFERLEDPAGALAMTTEFAAYCQQVYQREMSDGRLQRMKLSAYPALERSYQDLLARRNGQTESAKAEETAYWDKRTAPYLTFTNGELSVVEGEPLTFREKLQAMDFVRESIWPVIYVPEQPSCSFMSTQADESRFVFDSPTRIVFKNAFAFDKATVTDNGRQIVTITPNGDQGRLANLSAEQNQALLELFKSGGDFRVNLTGTQGMDRSHRIELAGFNGGYENYQKCRTRM